MDPRKQNLPDAPKRKLDMIIEEDEYENADTDSLQPPTFVQNKIPARKIGHTNIFQNEPCERLTVMIDPDEVDAHPLRASQSTSSLLAETNFGTNETYNEATENRWNELMQIVQAKYPITAPLIDLPAEYCKPSTSKQNKPTKYREMTKFSPIRKLPIIVESPCDEEDIGQTRPLPASASSPTSLKDVKKKTKRAVVPSNPEILRKPDIIDPPEVNAVLETRLSNLVEEHKLKDKDIAKIVEKTLGCKPKQRKITPRKLLSVILDHLRKKNAANNEEIDITEFIKVVHITDSRTDDYLTAEEGDGEGKN